MEESGRNPVYFNGNEISFPADCLYIGVRLINANPPYFCLKVVDGQNTKEYSFWTLEEAVYFKNKIEKCRTLEEVESLYSKLLSIIEDDRTTPRIRIQNNRISLSVDDINNIIANYYGRVNNKVSVSEELSIKDGTLYIQFFLSRCFDDEPIPKILRRELSEEDLKHVFNDLIKHENYELDSFQCIGGTRGIGNYFKEGTPYFEGIELYLKERVKPQRLNMTKPFGINE